LRPKDERWKNAKGSSTDALYLADCLKAKRTTVLTEGAIDALSIAQECGKIVNVVAVSGVQCGQNVENLARLALMPRVLVAFDADEAGDKEAKWWLERLPNARRLRPLLHDVNDMLVDNWDMGAWIEPYLPLEETLEIGECLCSACLDLGLDTPGLYEVDEMMYCEKHRPLDKNSRSDDYTQELITA
jgi:5S rRNA maturation endonuclease (ribonuclease M5)